MWTLLLGVASFLAGSALLLLFWPLILDQCLVLVLPGILNKLQPANCTGKASSSEDRRLQHPRVKALKGGGCFLLSGV